MTLYEINQQIANFNFNVDEETGEILNVMQLDELIMAREEKAENVALFVKNLRAEAEAIKAEEKALASRRKQTERKAESLAEYLQYCLEGEKLKTPLVSVSYRRTPAVEIEDEHRLIEWAQRSTEHGDTALKYRDPEISKIGVRQLIEEGVEVPGAQIVTHVSTIIK